MSFPVPGVQTSLCKCALRTILGRAAAARRGKRGICLVVRSSIPGRSRGAYLSPFDVKPPPSTRGVASLILKTM